MNGFCFNKSASDGPLIDFDNVSVWSPPDDEAEEEGVGGGGGTSWKKRNSKSIL